MSAAHSVLRRNTEAVDALGQSLPCPTYAAPEAWRRFAGRTVAVPGGCLLWLSPPRDDGYGQFWAASQTLAGAEVADDLGEALAEPIQLTLFEQTADPGTGLGNQGRPWRAHRWAYAAAYGELPRGQEVMHACDEPLCVRADHLELGTTAENAWDRDSRGRLVHRGKNGVMRWGRADRRAQYGRSLVLHKTLTQAIADRVQPNDLPGIIAHTASAGSPHDVPFDLG